MKKVFTSLNEKEHKELMKIVEKNGTTKYAIAKKLLKDFLADQKAVTVCSFYWLVCYALAVATVVLV